MDSTLNGLFTDFISSTFRTFGQLSKKAIQEALGGVALDRHLTNLLADPPPVIGEAPQKGKSIVLKPLSLLITEVTGKEPGTKAFAMAHSKKPTKKKGAAAPEALEVAEVATTAKKGPNVTLKDKWTGSPEDLEKHFSQVWSFNLAHQMLEEEGRRDQGNPPAFRYFTPDGALHLNDLEGEAQYVEWLRGLERPDKTHLELVVCAGTGKKKVKWAFAGLHLIISVLPPVAQELATVPKEEIVSTHETAASEALPRKPKGRPRKVVIAEVQAPAEQLPALGPDDPLQARQEPANFVANTVQVAPSVSSPTKALGPVISGDEAHRQVRPVLELATKDKNGEDFAPKKRYFFFTGNTNPKAHLSQTGLRKAVLVLEEPNAEALLHKTDLVAIPPAFIEAAKPWSMVEVIKEAQALLAAHPTAGNKPRRRSAEQKDIEELAQILINLEFNKSPKELAGRMTRLMEYLDRAVSQVEKWERENLRDRKGKIRQRWEKGKLRP